MKRRHRMPFGAELDGATTRFRLWAPGAQRVELVISSGAGCGVHAMAARERGWFEAQLATGAGARYGYRIDGGNLVPDPASRANPDDVHGASAVVDPDAYVWNDATWRGRPWETAVVYELHVGTFTREGTFAAISKHFDHLEALGVTAIELMPVADFPGRRNWGYDGVLPFAPESSYGTPDDLKRLVDEAHGRGFMMLLDVVYNHFGPEGNYLHAYAQQFFSPRHATPWGAAINFDDEGSRSVREFFVHNALYWLEEFHFDGLRLDAVHAIVDDSRTHLVEELASTVRSRVPGERRVHLILENDRNEAWRLARESDGAPVTATAQWNDDLHHALHVLVTGERDGYYADYADRPLHGFARALAEGFVYQGQPSTFRAGERRGEPSAALPPVAFVAFAQNHDQVGNRALGDRIDRAADPGLLRTAMTCLLLAPSIPMLFMGEEFASSSPFLFFCDFGADLAQAVTAGRRNEFARFERFRDPQSRAVIPDPNDEATFAASKLDWSECDRPPGARALSFHRQCLAVRRARIVPLIPDIERGGTFEVVDERILRVRWPLRKGRQLAMLASFATGKMPVGAVPQGETLYCSDATLAASVARGELPPLAVMLTLEPQA